MVVWSFGRWVFWTFGRFVVRSFVVDNVQSPAFVIVCVIISCKYTLKISIFQKKQLYLHNNKQTLKINNNYETIYG